MAPARDLLPNGRFHSLDALRGLAALSVVVGHWHHFFYHGTIPDHSVEAKAPFYDLLRIIYTEGYRAVDFFFCLSGFIFFLLYAEKISARRVQAAEFSLLRFSRLYPLHFVTLLTVAVGQWLMHATQGSFFVYPNNDPFHFIFQLTCTCGWWTYDYRDTFNGPFWSVSVEIFLYALFYLACRAGFRRWPHLVLIIGLGFILEFTPCVDLGRGVISFFAGGLIFLAYAALRDRVTTAKLWAAGLLTVTMWALAAYNLSHGYAYLKYRQLFGSHALIMGRDVIGVAMNSLTSHSFSLLVFPLTVLFLALLEKRAGHWFRRAAFLGDISYSSYLLHFPLQLALFGLVIALKIDREIFYSPWLFLAFFAVLIALSISSYRFFEIPIQRYLRTRFVRPPGTGGGATQR